MNKLVKIVHRDGFNSAMSSIFAILIGLAFGQNLPKWGFDKIFVNTTGTYKDVSIVNGGIIIAIIVAIIMYIILNKTIFGYELKACGFNSSASKYAGINEKRNIILSMVIAGALAGLGGLVFVIPTSTNFNATVYGYGFLALAVMIFGQWKPLRVLFAAFSLAL